MKITDRVLVVKGRHKGSIGKVVNDNQPLSPNVLSIDLNEKQFIVHIDEAYCEKISKISHPELFV